MYRQAVREKSLERKIKIVCSKMPLSSRRLEGQSNLKNYQFLCSSSSHLFHSGLFAKGELRQQTEQ